MPRGRFMNRPYEALKIKELLRCFFNSNSHCNCSTNHGVVTLYDRAFKIIENRLKWRVLSLFRCKISHFFVIGVQKCAEIYTKNRFSF